MDRWRGREKEEVGEAFDSDGRDEECGILIIRVMGTHDVSSQCAFSTRVFEWNRWARHDIWK